MKPLYQIEKNSKRLIYPFSFYGGKVNLFSWIASHLPQGHTFVDLFGGSGVVALNVVGHYKRVVYNDMDWRLVNFFWVLRDFPNEFIRKIELTPVSRTEHANAWEETDDPIEYARRTYVRIVQSYGKIGMRDTKSGWLLPQKGGNRTSAVLSRVDKMQSVVDSLLQMELENRPALELIKKESKPTSVLFADPPYVYASRTAVKAYYHEMTDQDHIDMCNAFNESSARVVLCGYENEIYGDLLKGWKVVKRDVVSVSSAGKRGKGSSARTECLWLKN